MVKKKKPGHFCWRCRRHRANEKFSGKGHQQHICKDCNKELKQEKRERKRANKKAVEAGLRPIKKSYPKTTRQAASYLQITVEKFESACEQLKLEPQAFDYYQGELVPLHNIDAMIAVLTFLNQNQ